MKFHRRFIEVYLFLCHRYKHNTFYFVVLFIFESFFFCWTRLLYIDKAELEIKDLLAFAFRVLGGLSEPPWPAT